MANTLFEAMSGVQPVNWGLLIHEFVEKSLPHIGRKPSFLSPCIVHLYQHYDCFTAEEEDMLTIATDEVVYKLGPKAKVADTGTEDSNDPAVPEEPPVSPTPSFRKPASPPPPPPRSKAGPSREGHWRDLLEGACGKSGTSRSGNILRELAKRADRKEIKKLETKKAQLAAQVAAMTQELSQKSEEIRKYHTEHAVVFNRIRELVGHPGEVVNKAHLYDRMMDSADPSSARQTLPILVKYSHMMKDLLVEIQKVVPPSGTPKRVLYPGPSWIANRDSVRSGGRSGTVADFPNGGWT